MQLKFSKSELPFGPQFCSMFWRLSRLSDTLLKRRFRHYVCVKLQKRSFILHLVLLETVVWAPRTSWSKLPTCILTFPRIKSNHTWWFLPEHNDISTGKAICPDLKRGKVRLQVGNFDQLVLGAQTTVSNKTRCKMKLRFWSFTHTQCRNQHLKSVSNNLESLQNFDQK